jgi:hypothetical protein
MQKLTPEQKTLNESLYSAVNDNKPTAVEQAIKNGADVNARFFGSVNDPHGYDTLLNVVQDTPCENTSILRLLFIAGMSPFSPVRSDVLKYRERSDLDSNFSKYVKCWTDFISTLEKLPNNELQTLNTYGCVKDKEDSPYNVRLSMFEKETAKANTISYHTTDKERLIDYMTRAVRFIAQHQLELQQGQRQYSSSDSLSGSGGKTSESPSPTTSPKREATPPIAKKISGAVARSLSAVLGGISPQSTNPPSRT